MDNRLHSYRKPSYNIKTIRTILAEAFSAEELKRLCFDRPLFHPIYARFTQMTSQDLMIDYLLEFCDQKFVFGELLSEIREQASQPYEKYKDQLYEAVTPEADSLDLEVRYSDNIPIPRLERNRLPVDIIQILLPDERYPLTEERQALLINLIAAVCNAPPDTVQILRTSPGSLWVGLSIPKLNGKELIKRFNTNDRVLRPLLAQFQIDDISKLPIQLPQTGFEYFWSEYTSLVRLLYLGAERVLIERELGGGYGGAMVLLAQPIHRQGRPMARQIIKIGVDAELRREYVNSVKYIERDLPLVIARLDNYIEWRGLAGITYNFIGDGMLGQTRTLEAYYQDSQVSTEKFIETLTNLLDKELGQRWYRHNTPHICFFAEEYSQYLIEHLRLKIRPASADGIWQADQWLDFTENYKRLSGEAILAEHRNISPSTLVQVDGLIISRVKLGELVLQLPNNSSVVVKIEYQPGNNVPLLFSHGDRIVVRGEVIYNRPGRMEQIVEEAFSGFGEATVDVKQDWLNWGDDMSQYPNPLRLYPKVLNQILRGKRSMIHGDLHLRNVVVDDSGRGWLIDFAQVTEKHNLYDFIKLETFLRQMILGQEKYQFSFASYLQLEEALVAVSLGRAVTLPTNPVLGKAYQVIQALREIASHYMGYPASFQDEYLPALFLYSLAILKYYNSSEGKATRLAFATAAVVAKALPVSELVALQSTSIQVATETYTKVQYPPKQILKSSDIEAVPGPQWEMIFDANVIRDLLTIALNESALDDLCHEYFPEVYRDFNQGMTVRERRQLLIDYCARCHQFPQLVRQIRKINPKEYKVHFPHLVKPVMDKFRSKMATDHIQAARTLGYLGEPGAIPLLETQLLRQQNPDVHYWLAIAIGQIGRNEAKEVLERIHQQLINQGVDYYMLAGIKDALNLAESKRLF